MMPKVKVNTLFNRVKIQRAKNKWDKDRMKRLDFVNKGRIKKITQEHTSIKLMKQ